MPPDTYKTCAEIAHQLDGNRVVVSIVPKAMPFDRDLPHGVRFADSKPYHAPYHWMELY
jgi:hypothetical protein